MSLYKFTLCVCVCVDSIQSQPKVFSAGLDIMEMYRKSPERCGEFWKAVQEMWLKLYGSNMVTIAAINVRIDHKQTACMSRACGFAELLLAPVLTLWSSHTRDSMCRLFFLSTGFQSCRWMSDISDL